MRYRKGRRGLYYEDGKLCNNSYNEHRLNPFELYAFTLGHQGSYFLGELWVLCVDLFYAICSIVTLPILGFLVWFHKYFERRHMSKEEVRRLKVRYPKEYYEELEY